MNSYGHRYGDEDDGAARYAAHYWTWIDCTPPEYDPVSLSPYDMVLHAYEDPSDSGSWTGTLNEIRGLEVV